MSNTLVQFRIEEASRAHAAKICEQLGIDLQTYIRICISRLISENGIPFSMNVNDMARSKANAAMLAMGEISRMNGNAEMSLEEINQEINEARKNRKKG